MTEQERAAKAQEHYRRMRAELDARLGSDRQLRKIAKKIREGRADFTDTAEYTSIVSDHIAAVIQENIGEINSPLGKQYVCEALLHDHYEAINDVIGEVQVAIDEKNGIRLSPKKPAYPVERVHQVAHALEDPEASPEKIRRRAGAPVANVARSFHDDYIKTNARQRSDLGFKCYLDRRMGAGACKWCAALAGRYVYGDHPEDIFRRHDNCTCTVTFENGRERQDVWSKRSWDARDPQEVQHLAGKPAVLSEEQAQELQENTLSGLTLAGKRDIIDLGSDAMFRRKKENQIEPMPKKQFQRIVKRFKAQGGIFQFNEETDSYLESRNAEAITYDAKTILIRQNPGRASVYEELIHTAQYRNGRNDGSYPSRLKCEIEAQEKLLRNAKAYKLTEPEIKQTQVALDAYKKELETYYKNGGE